MKANINSVHFKTDQKLDKFIQSKISKLSGLFDGIHSCEVSLKVVNTDQPDNKLVEIKMQLPGTDLIAKKQRNSFEEATDDAVDALKKQVIRHKEKIKGI